MKSKLNPLKKVLVAAVVMVANLSLLATSITWNAPATITGDTDMSTTGTLAYAYCWSGISTTVNGVSFTGTTSGNSAGTDVTLTGFDNNYSSFLGTGSASLSTAYQNMLMGADWNGSASGTITLNHLTVGHDYVVQFWVGDWRSYNTSRSETITGSASDNMVPTLTYQVGSGGSGSFVIGSFTASASTQTFTLTPGGSSPSLQINALQLRDLTPPASSIWTNTMGGSWPDAANWSNDVVAFGVGSTASFNAMALNGDVNVMLDGARTIGNLLFDDQNSTKHSWTLSTGNAGPLTLAVNSGVPVISNNVSTIISAELAGTDGLTKTGSGTLTLSAANTYTGGTTISDGTLQLGDGAIRNGSVSGVITNNGTLVVANPTAQTFANTIVGNGGFTKTGAGTLTLLSSNAYHGSTYISAGTLRLLPTLLTNSLQIMPLGDSITYGYQGTDAGYRGFLYNFLSPVAPNFQFVGAATVNPGSLPTSPVDETHHNGYSSYATLDLLNNLDGLDLTRYDEYGGAERWPNGGYWLTGGNGTGRSAVYPDIILLLVGANDISQATLGNTNINVVNYPTNLTALISKLVTLRPDAKLITADITPWPSESAYVTTVINMIHTVVTNFQAQGAHISEVDLNTGFPANGTSSDGVHPNDIGYSFMAHQWFDAILSVCTGVSSCIPSDSTVTVATNATLDLNGNQATIGGLSGSGEVVLGNSGILNIATPGGANFTFDGAISGVGALIKSGAGDLTLTGNNSYSGGTIISNGVLLAQGSSAGAVTISGGTFGGNGTVNGNVTVSGVIAPGTNGVGALFTGSNVWNSGGSYVCDINGTNTTACDQIVITGTLSVQATSGNPFSIRLTSLSGGNTPGPVSNFNKFTSYSWIIATSSDAVQNFATNKFILDTSSFSNDFSGGTFSVSNNGNSLVIHYTSALVSPQLHADGTLNGDSFSLKFSGPSGQTYQVITSTDVSTPLPNWVPLTSGTFGDGPVSYTDTTATNNARYYRIISP